MLQLLIQSPLYFVLGASLLLIAITVHEAAHAFMADRLGDPTPRSQGRLTLNPLAHLDPLGTLMLLIFRFGWGKPVQFDPYNLKNPRQDAALISLAGPASNIILATITSFLIRFAFPGSLSPEVFTFIYSFIFLNIGLAVFNLVPIHPLDGAKILIGLLPIDLALEWQSIMQRYGTIILLLMILPFSGVSPIITLIVPVVQFIVNLLLPGYSQI